MRTFAVFLALGLAVPIILLWILVVTYLLLNQQFPEFAPGYALQHFAQLLVGISIMVIFCLLPSVTLASIVAGLSARLLGTVPLWLTILLAPACGLVAALQDHLTGLDYSDFGTPSVWQASVPFTIAQFPGLLCGWLRARRKLCRGGDDAVSEAAA